MKIFVDAHKFDHSLQGTSTYIKGLYNALVKNDDITITLCAQDIDNLKKHFKDERFKFIELKSGSKYKRLAFEYPQIISKGNYDFAHFQYIVPPLKKCRYVNTLHDLLFLDFKSYFPWSYRLINGKLFQISAILSDVILTVSNYSRKSINTHYGIPLNEIHITSNAVPHKLDNSIDIKSIYNLDNYILFVSRFEPRKNHLTLLKAYLAAELYKQNYQLVFIGTKKEPIEIDAYNDLIQHIPVEVVPYVRFFEGLQDDELNSFYYNASCFVFPSLAEGFGIPPLEAAVNNTKVVCSDATAMADFDFFKYRFNPNSVENLREALVAVIADNEYPFEEIKLKILHKYNWDTIASEYYNILKSSLLNEK